VGVLIALVLIAGGAAGLHLMKSKGKELEGRDEGRPAGQWPGRRASEFAEALGALGAERARVKELVAQYMERLKLVTASRDVGDQEQLAARWAELYQWCNENGLRAEAQTCWMKAVCLKPRDPHTNRVLGRTATFHGVPVEPAQKAYLEDMGAWVRIANRHPEMEELRVELEGGQTRALPPSQTWDVRVNPGETVLLVHPGGRWRTSTARIRFQATHGWRQNVSLLSDDLLPAMRADFLRALPDIMSLWTKCRNPDHPWPEEELVKRGWKRITGGWEVVKGKEAVRFHTAAPCELVSITCGRYGGRGFEVVLELFGTAGGPPEVSVRGNRCEFVGQLQARDPDGQRVTLAGRPGRPAAVQFVPGETWVRARAGEWNGPGGSLILGAAAGEEGAGAIISYQIGEEPVEAVEWVMAALSPGYARKAEVEHVKRAYEALLSDVEYLEAEGKLLGSWHTDLWVQERMRPVCEREWQRGRRVAQARMLPLRVRRTAALGVTNPHEELYLEWPRFREALALTVGPAARRIESLPIRLELIPLMPEDEAVSMLRAEWQSLSAAQKVKALWALRFMCGPSVVGFLTRCTSDDEEQSVQTAAYLVLGDIGTSEALRACRGLSLKRGIRGAMRAARAGAGDQETMNELAQVLADSQAEEREAFLSCLLQMHSPSVLRALSVALEFYEREGDAARVAAHLGEMGGCAASSVLARLVEQHGDPYPDAVSQFRGAEMTPLLEPLANILDGEGDAAAVAALLLGASGSDLAVPVLSVAALERHLPEAVVGLAVQGSATALERAAQAADLIGSSELTTISDHWRKRDSAEDADAPWDWRPDVDKTAAAAFLQAVLRKGHDAETKVQAAELLVQIGEKPEPEGLLAVASLSIPAGQPSAKAPAAGGGPPGLGGGPMGLPGGGAFGAGPPMGPGGPMGPFQPGVGLPGQREQLPAERVMDLQKRALELLESVADVDVTSDLRELAESAKSPIGRAGALKILAQVADHETMAYLEELAGPPSGQPRSLEAGQQRLEARAAAIIALAAVGHPEAVTFLADLWFEEPPRLEDFVRRPSAKAYEAALAERGTMVRKAVCQAVLALPTGKTLYSAARDKKQAEALIEAIRAAAENGAVAVATQPSVLEETALAIQSLGRTGRLSARAWATIEALAKEEVPLPEALRSAVADALAQTRGAGAGRGLPGGDPGPWRAAE